MTVIPAGSELPAAPPAVRRHHGVVRVAHWLNAVTLAGMIASGLQIYLAFPHFGTKERTYALPNPFDGGGIPEAARLGRVARGRPQLALRARVAVRPHRARLPRVPRLLRRVARTALPAQGRAAGHRDAAVLPAPAARAPAAGQAQRAAEGGLHLHRGAGRRERVLSGFAIYKPVQLSWLVMAVRWLRARALLALPRGVDLHRVHRAARGAGVRRRSGLASAP